MRIEVALEGRLGSPPHAKISAAGKPWTSLSLATGGHGENVEWVSVALFDEVAAQRRFTGSRLAGDEHEAFTIVDPIDELPFRLVVLPRVKNEARVWRERKRLVSQPIELLVHVLSTSSSRRRRTRKDRRRQEDDELRPVFRFVDPLEQFAEQWNVFEAGDAADRAVFARLHEAANR